MPEIPIPIHLHSFLLVAKRNFTNNLNAKITYIIDGCGEKFQIYKEKIYGIVIDSHNIMIRTRLLCAVVVVKGKFIAPFAYVCVIHALSLVIKYINNIDEFEVLFKGVVTMATYFKNTHFASHFSQLRGNNKQQYLKQSNLFVHQYRINVL